MDLAHTRLLVHDFASCYRFYRDTMQLKPSWGDENGGYASFTQANNSKIVLAIFDRQEMAEVNSVGEPGVLRRRLKTAA